MARRDHTFSQRKALNRIIRHIRRSVSHNGVTSVRMEIRSLDWGPRSVVFRTRRSDCGPNSLRAVMCEQRYHFIITSRGGVTLCDARQGIGTDGQHRAHAAHTARMLSHPGFRVRVMR